VSIPISSKPLTRSPLMASHPTNLVQASSARDHVLTRRRILRVMVPAAIIICLAAGWLVYSASAGSSTSSATRAGIAYAQDTMEWTSGPTLTHARVARVRDLPAVLPQITGAALRQDVNTADLQRRYGPDRQVDLVVLSGVFNTLAPDEGVNVHGEVLAVVDVKTNRVLFLTD
ncbi:MAG TPA: hypothetical protein VF221_00880, partial [Chloroflexota bacterium]